MKLHTIKRVTPDVICPHKARQLGPEGVKRSINSINKQLDPDREHTYSFIGGSEAQHNQVRRAFSETLELVPGLKLKEISANADIRISFKPNGSYSYIGTDIYLIRKDLETMNIGWFEESGRHIKHELGHTASLLHEHLHPVMKEDFNWPKIYERFAQIGWTKADVDNNFILNDPNPYIDAEIDNPSLMKYYLECDLTHSGKNCEDWNEDWSKRDIERLNELFPFKDVEEEIKEDNEVLTALQKYCRTLKYLPKGLLKLLAGFAGITDVSGTKSKIIQRICKQ